MCPYSCNYIKQRHIPKIRFSSLKGFLPIYDFVLIGGWATETNANSVTWHFCLLIYGLPSRWNIEPFYIAARPTVNVIRYRVESISQILYLVPACRLSHFCWRKIESFIGDISRFITYQLCSWVNNGSYIKCWVNRDRLFFSSVKLSSNSPLVSQTVRCRKTRAMKQPHENMPFVIN